MTMKLKKGDKVMVRAGRDKGKVGEILSVLRATNKVVVAGVNKVKRHTKASAKSPGGIIEKELPLHVSNVGLLDPKTQKPTRIGYSFAADGTKQRVAKKSGTVVAN